MDIENNYKNIDRIRIYRNKAFHSKIKFLNEDKWGNRRIRLRNNINLRTVDVIADFLKVFFFVNTFKFLMYNLERALNGTSIEDRLIDKL